MGGNRSARGRVICAVVFSVLAFYIVNRIAAVFLASGGGLDGFSVTLAGVVQLRAYWPVRISLTRQGLLAGLCAAALVWMIWLYRTMDRKNYMPGAEHGSARWGGPKDIKPLMNPVPDLNIPLSATEQISLLDLFSYESNRNRNVTVVGGSGSGKTYGIYYPSIMQLHGSYVITDPKGTMLTDVGNMLANAGYEMRVFNTVDMASSMHYNPLAYIRSESDILKVVNVLIENTKGEGSHAGEDFWVKAERMMFTALIAYLWQEAPPEEQTISMLAQMLSNSWVREDDEEYVNPIDVLFERLRHKDPDCLAVRQYAKYKLAAGKTAKSILVSCGARLSPFDIKELRDLTSHDELGLDTIGDRKTALFVVMSDTDTTYSFLVAMMMYQMFNLLCTKADTEYGGKLPVPVRCLLDEFYNIGKIPNFEHLISTVRSRNISCMLGLQSLAQLQTVYKDAADGIIDNCDTLVFLGGKSTKTTKQISEMVGKTTIDTRHTSENKGKQGSVSTQYNTLARDLIDPSEIARLGRKECLVLITGLPPFRSRKVDPAKHPRFKQIKPGGAPAYRAAQALAVLPASGGEPEDCLVLERVDLTELKQLIEKEHNEHETERN